MPLTVGDSIGHYDVTALIGEGGMGPPPGRETFSGGFTGTRLSREDLNVR